MKELMKALLKPMYHCLIKTTKKLTRACNPPEWHNLKNLQPISRVFGFDRGTPIHRVYIEHFLNKNSYLIKGNVCEIGDDAYTKKFGRYVNSSDIMHYTNDYPKATIVADLTKLETLPKEKFDCFILIQTLDFIYDYKAAIKGVHYTLKKGGVVLATVAGISQISRYDYERWGHYYCFTDLSMKLAFEEVFGKGNVEVYAYGNVLSAIATLEGISAEELSEEDLFYHDLDYQVIIGVRAIKI